jgi:glycosyltransferase involved in cell wall biosynthesis
MRITCVHQGFELYGSDRSFIESVRVLRERFPNAVIDIVLPSHGPIVPWLEPYASSILIEPLWILRRRDLPKLMSVGLARLPLAVAKALRRIRRSDVVYVNTSVVADYLLAAALDRRRTLAHIHEIPEGMVRHALRLLVRASGARLIFNSRATKAAFALPSSVHQAVVYNGIADPGGARTMTYDGCRPLRVLMLGRISRIKGQEVLVEALRRLPAGVRDRVEVRIVGNAFEDVAREAALADAISTAGLTERVRLLPFIPDPGEHYRWADIVAVPSRLPESLGRVAIEAMAHGKPPLVSDIGGLPEVVEAGRTGWSVPPDDPASLATALAEIVAKPESWAAFPAAARSRYERIFTQAACAEALTAEFTRLLHTGPRPSPAPVTPAVSR